MLVFLDISHRYKLEQVSETKDFFNYHYSNQQGFRYFLASSYELKSKQPDTGYNNKPGMIKENSLPMKKSDRRHSSHKKITFNQTVNQSYHKNPQCLTKHQNIEKTEAKIKHSRGQHEEIKNCHVPLKDLNRDKKRINFEQNQQKYSRPPIPKAKRMEPSQKKGNEDSIIEKLNEFIKIEKQQQNRSRIVSAKEQSRQANPPIPSKVHSRNYSCEKKEPTKIFQVTMNQKTNPPNKEEPSAEYRHQRSYSHNSKHKKNEDIMNDKDAVRLVIVGDGGVGKTSMILSYTKNEIPNDHVPTIFQNYSADIKVGEKLRKVLIWDTAGQDEYKEMRSVAIKKADIVLICFSMVDENSFKNALKKWYPEVVRMCPVGVIQFIGTKIDLYNEYLMEPKSQKKVMPLEKVYSLMIQIEMECNLRKCEFYSCSSLDQTGLNKAFTAAITQVSSRKFIQKDGDEKCQLI